MNKPWKIVLLLVAIFGAGGVSGWFLAQSVGHNPPNRHTRPKDWATEHVKKLTERLGLTDGQRAELTVIVQRNSDELNRVRISSFVETRKILERMRLEVAEKLTPAQREKYDEFTKEFREKMKKSMPERANRTGPAGAAELPPPADKPPPH